MYDKKETDISYIYLKKIISLLKEPIVIIGGWATYFTVNERYKKEFGVDYIGSKDVDLGFNDLKSLKETCIILEKNGFILVGFRYLKEINYETGKELTKEETIKLPIYNIFQMYIDLLVSHTNKKIIKEIGFAPADEPLVKHVFENINNRTELIEFDKKLWLPSPELLLATKLNSVINREKNHKKIKDYCDILSLILYSNKEIDTIISLAKKYISKEKIDSLKKEINLEEIKEVSKILNINEEIIQKTFKKL
jgi:hypothetical protein